MCFNFVNIQTYGIKLTQKLNIRKNLAGTHVTQVDVDVCYEWGPSKLQVVFYHHYQSIWMPGLVCEGNQLILMIDTLFLL